MRPLDAPPTARGSTSGEARGSAPSPGTPRRPLPATVSTRPVLRCTRRMRRLSRSARKRLSRGVQGGAIDAAETGLGGGALVAAEAFFAGAGQARDDTGLWVDLPHAVVPGIRDEDIAAGHDRETVHAIESRLEDRKSVV